MITTEQFNSFLADAESRLDQRVAWALPLVGPTIKGYVDSLIEGIPVALAGPDTTALVGLATTFMPTGHDIHDGMKKLAIGSAAFAVQTLICMAISCAFPSQA